MKPSFILAALAVFASSVSFAQLVPEQHCSMSGYTYACYSQPFIVDAYSSYIVADQNFRSLGAEQKDHAFLLTTTDPTRRALVVYPWDFTRGPLPNCTSDGYVAELYGRSEDADRRFESLSPDQQAGGYKLRISEFRTGGGVLVVYRSFFRPRR